MPYFPPLPPAAGPAHDTDHPLHEATPASEPRSETVPTPMDLLQTLLLFELPSCVQFVLLSPSFLLVSIPSQATRYLDRIINFVTFSAFESDLRF